MIKLVDGSTLEPPDEAVCERLKAVRKAHGFSQEKFSEILGVSSRTYKYYEQGMRAPSWDFVVKFITEFKLEAEWVAFGDKGRPETPNKGTDG